MLGCFFVYYFVPRLVEAMVEAVRFTWRVRYAVPAAGALLVGLILVAGGYWGGLHPFPFFPVVVGFPVYLFFCVPLTVFAVSPDNRRAYPQLLRQCVGLTVFMLAMVSFFSFYLVWFKWVGVDNQIYLTPLLPLLKWSLKVLLDFIVGKMNADVSPALIWFLELYSAIFTAFLFGNVTDPLTFVMIIGFDIVGNLYYCWRLHTTMGADAIVTTSWDTSTAAAADLAAGGDVAGIAHRTTVVARGALTSAAAVRGAKFLISMHLFVQEVCELVVPFQVAAFVWIARNSHSRDEFAMVRNMSDAQFALFLRWSLLDGFIEMGLFALLQRYVGHITGGLDMTQFGMFFIRRYLPLFFTLHTSALIFVIAVTIYPGNDYTFQFPWL